jgi:hypothetical protein
LVASREEGLVTMTESSTRLNYSEASRKPHKAPDGMTPKRDLKDIPKERGHKNSQESRTSGRAKKHQGQKLT